MKGNPTLEERGGLSEGCVTLWLECEQNNNRESIKAPYCIEYK